MSFVSVASNISRVSPIAASLDFMMLPQLYLLHSCFIWLAYVAAAGSALGYDEASKSKPNAALLIE